MPGSNGCSNRARFSKLFGGLGLYSKEPKAFREDVQEFRHREPFASKDCDEKALAEGVENGVGGQPQAG